MQTVIGIICLVVAAGAFVGLLWSLHRWVEPIFVVICMVVTIITFSVGMSLLGL